MTPPRDALTLIPSAHYRTMPWKNGAGSTREIAIFPASASLENNDFLWRLSSARVERSGPFSRFPECDRWLVVVDGDGLLMNGHPQSPLTPFLFAGEATTQATLVGGPIVDLGLVFRRSKVRAIMSRVELAPNQVHALQPAGSQNFLYCARGALSTGDLRLDKGDTLAAGAMAGVKVLASPSAGPTTIIHVSIESC